MLTYNTLVVLLGAALLGMLCGVVGSFAVLRRRALLGDVLAHAALPGLALAFLVTRTKALPVLLLGALASGLFGLACLSYVRRRTRTKEDAAMGLVLAVLFGAGIALSRFVQNTATDASASGLDSFIFGKTAGMVMSDVLLTIAVSLVAVTIIVLFLKEFQLVCFDTGFAQSLGWRVGLLDFAILALLALAVVAGLPMVGVVMIAALTIIPPVSARLWAPSLKSMLVLAAMFGLLSATSGVLISAAWERMPSGPVIVLCAAFFFVFSALAAPGRGLMSNMRRVRQLRLQYGLELFRKLLREDEPEADLLRRLGAEGVPNPPAVLRQAEAQGFVRRAQGLVRSVVRADEGG